MAREVSIAAGDLRDRVTLIRTIVDAEPNESGNTSETVEEVRLWADVLELSGRERLINGAVQAMRQATIRFRSNSVTRGISEDDRIEARGESWAIRGVARLGRSGELVEAVCDTGGAD